MSNKKIVDELTKAYWAEIETIMNYIAHSVNLDGVRAEAIKKSLAADISEELVHAQGLAKRIKELGGKAPGSFDFKAAQESLQPKKDTTDVTSVIKGVIDAEQAAIKQYNKMIRLCDGHDYVTQDLCVRILSEEEAHKINFDGYLKEYQK
jgi:bacterioferritin